jgi:RNA polymerase sigma-70 factor (ECF subfamily)
VISHATAANNSLSVAITSKQHERFETLLDKHKKILYKVANLYSKSREDREDVAQEILAQLWRSFASFDGRVRFSTWMYRIALNVAISAYRRESTRERYVLSDEEEVLKAVDSSATHRSEELQVLYQFIDGLDPLNKALLMLYLDGNSYAETAQVLGISETNVATKISRLKQQLKHGKEE